MIIKEGKIALRPFKLEDYKTTLQWRQEIELRKLAQFHSFPVTEEIEQQWIDSVLKDRSDKSIYYAIENFEENRLIGYFLLKDINWINRIAKMGIILGDIESRGKGIGKIALELALKYTFNNLNLRKITLDVISDNKAAIALYEKVGFVEEGLLKKHFYFDSMYYDVKIMSLFNSHS
jgi:RimJ/RimL family protein N-acetyltransferase